MKLFKSKNLMPHGAKFINKQIEPITIRATASK
jgi:hypothetical protein